MRRLLVVVSLVPFVALSQAADSPIVTCGMAYSSLQAEFVADAAQLAPYVCEDPGEFNARAVRLLDQINARIERFNTRFVGEQCDPDMALPLAAKNSADVRLVLQQELGAVPLDKFCNGISDTVVLCGNNLDDPGELCDGSALGGQSCASLGNGTGTLACASNCQSFDLSGCSGPAFCGNGVIEDGEACDARGSTATCDSDCTVPACGDGTVNPFAGEQCDAGGPAAFCDADCTIATCGDGTLNPLAGEQCDAGGQQTTTCEVNCRIPACGDGILNVAAGEACDDGNGVSGDGCSATCGIEGVQASRAQPMRRGPGLLASNRPSGRAAR